MQQEKAMYGCLRNPLLFYRKLRKEINTFGFVANPYDTRVEKKWVIGSQTTVVCHVDDIKISHKEPEEVTAIIAYLEAIYGKITVKRRKNHTYLGMDIDLSDGGLEKICMSGYIDEAVE